MGPARMLHREYLDVSEVKSAEDLRSQFIQFSQRRDFELCGLTVISDRPGAESEFHSVHNTPERYLDAYNDPANWKRDPVAQHCKRRSLPIVWDQATYVGADAGDLWEEQAPVGYKTGIALALHLPEGQHLFVGINRDRALPANRAELSRLVADLQLFATCTVEIALEVLAATSRADIKSLAPRELECLSWTMEGKTAWEVGAIVGLAEATVVSYLRNAMRKLNCASKHQAVVRALRLGLIR